MRPAIALLPLLFASSVHAGTTEEHRALMIAGQVMRNDGKLLRARDILAECRDQACDGGAAECEEIRHYCGTKVDETIAEIPSVFLRVRDDRGLALRASVRADASAVDPVPSLDLDPGHHVLRASYAGVEGSAEIDLAKGHKDAPVTIALDLRREVASRPVPRATFVLSAIAGLAAANAIGFAIAVQVQTSNMAYCKPTCDPSGRGLFQATTITVDASMIVAAASALAGAAFFFTRPTRTRVVHLEERVEDGAP